MTAGGNPAGVRLLSAITGSCSPAVVAIEPEREKDFLRSIPIFGGLQDAALERICGMLETHEVAAGTVVCQQGELGRSMYIVRRGDVVVRRNNSSGSTVKVTRLGSGEFFGETTLIEISPRSYSVTAENPATLYTITNKSLYSLYRDDLNAYVMVLGNLARELSRRLRKAENRVCELAEENGDERTQILSNEISKSG